MRSIRGSLRLRQSQCIPRDGDRYPSGRVVNFGYATGGGCCNSRLASVADQTTSTTLADTMTFNAAGATLTRTLNPGANALTETFSYNSRMEVTEIKATKSSTD